MLRRRASVASNADSLSLTITLLAPRGWHDEGRPRYFAVADGQMNIYIYFAAFWRRRQPKSERPAHRHSGRARHLREHTARNSFWLIADYRPSNLIFDEPQPLEMLYRDVSAEAPFLKLRHLPVAAAMVPRRRHFTFRVIREMLRCIFGAMA